MSALAVNPAYAALLVQFPPRIIRSADQNDAYIDALYQLEKSHETGAANQTTQQSELAELLTLLIENYEDQHYTLPKASTRDMLQFLMDQHSLNQQQLAAVLGTPSIVSELMHGKRELNKNHIRRLSERFHVSPEVFF